MCHGVQYWVAEYIGYKNVFIFSDLRQPTQDAPEEVRARDFRRELEERERVAAREKTRERGPRGWSLCQYLRLIV